MRKKCFLLFAAVLSALALTAEDVFHFAVPGHVFTSHQPVTFTVKTQTGGVCRIFSYDGRKILETPVPLTGKVTVPPLPNGYYPVEFSDGKTVEKSDLTVVPDLSERKTTCEMPYSMDLAFGNRADTDKMLPLVRLLGLKYARERLHHRNVEKSPGNFDWERAGIGARKIAAGNVRVSAVCHHFADWAKTSPQLSMAKDIFTPYRFAKAAGEQFKDQIRVWEFWNEPELHFATKDGPWEYAAMLKAAYLGFKAASPELLMTNASHCHEPWKNLYAQEAFRNDIADYMDIFNFHVYDPLCRYPEIVRGWRSFLKTHGIGDVVFWNTENGTNAEGLAVVKSPKGNVYYQTPEQEMIWAEFVPKSQILMQDLGVAHTFFFILRHFHERSGKKEWGILRGDYSAKPGYAAFSTLVQELGNAQLLGEVELGSAMRGFLYRQPDRSLTLAFWSISELETESESNKKIPWGDWKKRSFAIAGDSATVIDVFGTPHKIAGKDGKIQIPANRMPSYLHCAPSMKIKRLPAPVGKTGPRNRMLERSIVFRILPSADFRLKASRLSMLLDDRAKNKDLILQVANFSDQTKDVTVTVQGADLPGFPAKVTVKPFSAAEIKTSASGLPAGKYILRFQGSCRKLPVSCLEFPFRVTSLKPELFIKSMFFPKKDAICACFF